MKTIKCDICGIDFSKQIQYSMSMPKYNVNEFFLEPQKWYADICISCFDKIGKAQTKAILDIIVKNKNQIVLQNAE